MDRHGGAAVTDAEKLDAIRAALALLDDTCSQRTAVLALITEIVA